MKKTHSSKNTFIYLDYAATTPVDSAVLDAMQPYWQETFGNAGSVHQCGAGAIRAIDESRESLVGFLNADSLREIIFTGSATEANNLAIIGAVNATTQHDKPPVHIIASTIEHESVLVPLEMLAKQGLAEVSYIPPDNEGIINPEDIKQALRPETVLVSVGYANNEIGTVQDIPAISHVIAKWRKSHNTKTPYLHSDAVQATTFLSMDTTALGVDLLTLSGHKIYGPKGIGALYRRDGIPLIPIMHGGGQEYGIRPGTENVPLIVGMGAAINLLTNDTHQKFITDVQKLRTYAIKRIQQIFPKVEINGSLHKRLPHNINVYLPGISSEMLIVGLSEKGICISSGAACSARTQKPSHVIQAIKHEAAARSSVRITLGKQTTKHDVDALIDALSAFIHNKT